MTSMTLAFSRRLPWPAGLSLVLHGAVIGWLFYQASSPVIILPSQAPPISITLVAPEPEPQPVVAAPVPQPVTPAKPQPVPEPVADPVIKPEPIPEPPKPAEIVINKPQPKVKEKPKTVKQRRQPKPEPVPEQPRVAQPVTDKIVQTRPAAPAATTAPVDNGPKIISRLTPTYPPRALALQLEGQVRLKYDVDSNGRVTNIDVVSAHPRNMFERSATQSIKQWRYETGKPGQGLTANFKYQINGSISIQ